MTKITTLLLMKCSMMKFEFFVFVLFTIIVAGVSQETADINQYCNSKSDCGSYGYICEQNKTCQCDKYYVPNKSRKKCVGGVGQNCKYDEYCISGAFCEHQTRCKCKDNLFPIEDGLICSNSSQVVASKLFLMVAVIFSLCSVLYFSLN